MLAACAVPVKLPVGFVNTPAVAVIVVGYSCNGLELAFGIPGVEESTVAGCVTRGVIRKRRDVIAPVGCDRPEHRLAAAVISRDPAVLGEQVPPRVVGILISPAVLSRRCQSSGTNDAIHLVVGKALRAAAIESVPDGIDVSSVFARCRIDKAVCEVHGVAADRRGLKFEWLEAIVIYVRDIETGK